MSNKDDLDLVNYALQEVKYQYRIYLEGFDDIKKKNQILLLICSLIITLPLSSDYIVSEIMKSTFFVGIFISGVLCLIISIVLLLISMIDTQIEIPYFYDILNSIGKYRSINVKKAVVKRYAYNLDIIVKKIEDKRKPIRFAEKLILYGIILVIGALLLVMI